MGLDAIVTNEGLGRLYDGFGGYWERGCLTEQITLDISGTSPIIASESVADLLPADSIIEAVTARITTTLTGFVDWSIGDGYVSDRFSGPDTALTAGTTVVGLNHVDALSVSPSIGARQTLAGKIVISTSDSPTAGVIRVSVFYRKFVAPTS